MAFALLSLRSRRSVTSGCFRAVLALLREAEMHKYPALVARNTRIPRRRGRMSISVCRHLCVASPPLPRSFEAHHGRACLSARR